MLQKSSRCHPTRVLTRLFNCTKCKKGFTTAKAALKHEKDHHSEDGKPFKCKLCQVKFSHSWAVTNHLRKGRCKGSQIISWELLDSRLPNILRSHLLPKNKLHDLHVTNAMLQAIACIYFKPCFNAFYHKRLKHIFETDSAESPMSDTVLFKALLPTVGYLTTSELDKLW